MKTLYLGNSITLHDISPGICWYGAWWIAVSAEEKDYVHILNRMIEGKESITVEYIVLNIADFELSPDTFVLDNLAELREWRPDVLILRICENTQEEKVEAFGAAYLKLIRYFHQDELKIYAVGTFWKHEAKEACICKAGELPEVTYVSLEYLHSTAYQAIGQFEHAGVAAHPSDKGMQAIADAIFTAMN